MAGRAARRTAAIAAGLVSLGLAGYSGAMQVAYMRLLATTLPSQIAPLPAGSLPNGATPPQPLPPLTRTQRATLDRLLWRDPLDPKLFNLFYADGLRTGQPNAVVQQRMRFLAALGWRYTPAQQNLMTRAALEGRYRQVLDRVDALLRRQKLLAVSFAVLNAMEASPVVRKVVVDRLQAQPKWRQDYLAVISAQSSSALLDARVRTLDELQRAPGGVGREEMASSLVALTASGRGREAHQLWIRHSLQHERGNLVYDPRFRDAAAFAGADDLTIPFEWKLGQDLGYTVQASADGVMLSWDGRGVPVFLSQTVPVTPGRSYVLAIQGTSSVGSFQHLFAPALLCGPTSISFESIAGGVGEARYRSPNLPSACDMGVLTINGSLSAGTGGTDVVVSHITLQRLG